MITAANNQLSYFNLDTTQGSPQKMDNSSFLNVADRCATSGMTDVSAASAGVGIAGTSSRAVGQPRSRTTNINQKQKRLKRPPVFPLQLYDMLTEAEKDPALQAIVSWLPDGKSFLVHNEKGMDYVLERYFKGIKISSFTRQLQIYGFARYKGVCTHVLLQRGQRHLLRNKSLDDFQSLSLNKKDNSRGGGSGGGGRTSTTTKSTPPATATSVDPQAITGMSTSSVLKMPAPAPLSVMLEQDRQKQQQQLQQQLQQEFGTISPAVVSQSSANSISSSSSSSSSSPSSSGDVFEGKWDDLSWLSGVVDLEPLQKKTSKTTTTNTTTIPTTAANIVDDSSSSRQSSRFSSSSCSPQQQEQHGIFEPSTSSFDALIESMDLDAQFGDDVFSIPMRFALD